MMGNSISRAPADNPAQALAAQICLDQACQQRTEQHLDVALILYDQAKVTFQNLADANQITLPLSRLKSLFARLKRDITEVQPSQTPEEAALRQRIADIYYERAEILATLGDHDKAKASREKALVWDGKEANPASTNLAVSLFAHSALALTQTATSASRPIQWLRGDSSRQEKSKLVDYLFEKALSTLGSLEVPDQPSLFLVYAHNNPTHGKAEAGIAEYLIHKLSEVQYKLYSDQTPTGKPYSSTRSSLGDLKNRKDDGKLHDILTNQLCLLPDQLRDGVEPVNQVVVCCSEVLEYYLKKWEHYETYRDKLKTAYNTALDQKNDQALRDVIEIFSQEKPYCEGFHHILTEIAFLEIRKERWGNQHGIIPVSLTSGSAEQCLKHFIPVTTIRMEDIPRFDEQAQAGRVAYPNQGRHWVLFKLLARLFVNSDEAKTFLNKFWHGYCDCLARLKRKDPLGELEFTKLVDGIFDGIRAALHNQLAFTVQQQHQQLRALRADPRAALKELYFALLKQDKAFQETQELYVEPHDKASSPEAPPLGLLTKVQDFLFLQNKQVVLLKGDSGAGKTTFSRMLEKQLWGERKRESDPIPLCISLPSIDKPEHDLISKALKRKGLSAFQIQKLKQEEQKFVFILDGYDEIRQTQNLYLSNSINQSGSWHGHMVISCRSEYLGQDYRSRFQPNPNLKNEDSSFQEVEIEPFSVDERNAYIDNYVVLYATGWTAQQYQDKLNQDHLKNLVGNPFLLRVALDALPYLEDEGQGRTPIQLRLDLYGQFVKGWFERNAQRLSMQDLTENQRAIFKALCDEGFAEHGIAWVQDLAVHLYTENAGNPVVEYLSRKDKGNWKEAFFGLEDEQQLLRKVWPLNRSGNQYRFIHKSLLEYFVAHALFESLDACMVSGSRPRHGSEASIYSFKNEPVLPSRTQQDLSLAPKHWVGDLGVIGWLTDRVKQEPAFKEQLLAIIERSKTDAGVSQAAANAITVLVRAGVQFNSAGLLAIRIPGADLSYGVFDSAQLQGADLSKTNLTGIWLRNADLTRARMGRVQFGELPSLRFESGVNACCYSPDRRYLAAATSKTIALYEVETLAHVHTFEGHTSWVTSVVFSIDGQTLASGSEDLTVRLWSVAERKPLHTFEGYISRVTSVAFSIDGQTLASGSEDTVVRLWSVAEKKALHTFKGHTDWVKSVAFSIDGQTLASGSYDKTVRLWSVAEKKALHTFEGHTDRVRSVAFSPNGQTLASGSEDLTVRLWSVEEKKPLHTFEGHTDWVKSVAFSIDGQTLASGSKDNTVRLWSAAEKKPLHTFEGHTNKVNSVALSSDGQTLASGSRDKTVRLWSVDEKKPLHTFEGHTDWVTSVALSPNGQMLASGSGDKTVRLWSVAEKKALHTFEGHTNMVTSVAFSIDGQTLASGSWDRTVRLWSVAEKKPLHTFKGHTYAVTSVALSPNGQMLASGSWDKTVRLWSVAEKKALHTFEGHTKSVISVAFSSDGQTLASGSEDTVVRLWSVDEKKPLLMFEGYTDWGVTSVAFSSDGQTLASGSVDKTVMLWSVAEKELLHIFEGHTDWVTSVAFSPNGQMLASGSDDKTVRLWSITSGECLTVIQGFNGAVNSVAWYTNAEGIWLATGGADKVIRLWQVHRDGEACRVTLHWASAQTTLTVPGMSIQEVIGLSARNTQLLKQRGATGEPHQTEEQEARSLPTEGAVAPAFTLPVQAGNRSGSTYLNFA